MELGAEYRLCVRDIIRSILHGLSRSNTTSTFRQLGDTVPMRHPYLRVLIKTLKQRVLTVDKLQLLTTVLTRTGTLHLTAVTVTYQLCAVAYTQYRQTTADSAQVDMERILLIYAQW